MLYEKTSNCMRKTIFFLMLVSISISAISQSKTIVLFEKETYYPDQVWFASHVQKDIEDSIQFYWNHGYRITDASYNSCGWVVVMAKNSGIRMQTYKFHQYWPSEWISTSRKSQYTYRITSMACDGPRWFVICSQQNTNERQEEFSFTEWNNIEKWIGEFGRKGYFVTNVCYDGFSWRVLVDRSTTYKSQQLYSCHTYDAARHFIKESVWGRRLNVHYFGYAGGRYVVMYGEYANGYRSQRYIEIAEKYSVKKHAQENREMGYAIAKVGCWSPAKRHQATPSQDRFVYNPYAGMEYGQPTYTAPPASDRFVYNPNAGTGYDPWSYGTPAPASNRFVYNPNAGTELNMPIFPLPPDDNTFQYNPYVPGEEYDIFGSPAPMMSPSNTGSPSKPQKMRTCPGCDGKGYVYDSKEYAPRYTANTERVWCDECHGYDDRHYHKRPRCQVCGGRGEAIDSYN